jgi:hypothetical protein
LQDVVDLAACEPWPETMVLVQWTFEFGLAVRVTLDVESSHEWFIINVESGLDKDLEKLSTPIDLLGHVTCLTAQRAILNYGPRWILTQVRDCYPRHSNEDIDLDTSPLSKTVKSGATGKARSRKDDAVDRALPSSTGGL